MKRIILSRTAACLLAVLLLSSCKGEGRLPDGRVDIREPLVTSDINGNVTTTEQTTTGTSAVLLTQTEETTTQTEPTTVTVSETEQTEPTVTQSETGIDETRPVEGITTLERPTETTTEATTTAATTELPPVTEQVWQTTAPTPSYTGTAAVRKERITQPYAYHFMTEAEKLVYTQLCTAIHGCDSSELVPAAPISADAFDKLLTTVLYYDNTAFYLDNTYKVAVSKGNNTVRRFSLLYTMSAAEATAMKAAADNRCQEIYAMITPSMSEYDIVKLFHDELIRYTAYDLNSGYGETIYGALVEGKASCQGYSKAFAYLCDGYGIPNIIITGDFSGPHMWNMVRLGDSWYYMDITNDDPGNSKYTKHIEYKYFLMTTEQLKKTHTLDSQPFAYPTADNDVQDYFRLNGLVADSYEKAVEIAYNEILRITKAGEDGIEFRCSDSAVFEEVYERFYKKAELLDIVRVANMSAESKLNETGVTYNSEKDGTNIISVFFTYS